LRFINPKSKIQNPKSNRAAPNIETIVSLAKRRGFVYPASEIYGGLGSSWDYGPLGVELANNIKQSWWRWLVHERDDIEGLDSSIIQNRLVWKYSGHEATFSDPLVDCRNCKSRFRTDKLEYPKISDDSEAQKAFEQTPVEQLIEAKKFPCPNCGSTDFTEPRQFNLMFSTTVGATSAEDDPNALAYLRPETAQGIFINFANVLNTSRRKLPFGIAQIGKAFRNEVTPGNFIFRTREFEQMELEYFCKPEDAPQIHQEFIDGFQEWFKTLGILPENIMLYEQSKKELSHYSDRTVCTAFSPSAKTKMRSLTS
jgi:glycyl-tRNA synthetase